MPDRARLRRLAARLAQDRPIRWDEEERRAASESERVVIRELRAIGAMLSFGEALQSTTPSADLQASVSVARSIMGAENDASAPDNLPSLSPGTRWAHLEILQRVARGGFGEVYRARDTRLDRIVALKLLAEDVRTTGDEVVREARLLARIHHPHVVTVHGADRVDGRVGIWMEFLEGETLEQLLRQRGRIDSREAALIGIDLCRALSAVHAAGIAHRDVKLANVMRAEGGRIVLMDFGLGHDATSPGQRGSERLSGTPLFMAPEVLRGAPETARSDIYSLGVVLFALVTGKLPVPASTFSGLLAQHARGAIRRARDLQPDLPEAFAHVLDRALDPDSRARFQTVGEAEIALLRSLGAAVQIPEPRANRHPRRGVAMTILAAAFILAGSGGMWLWLQRSRTETAPMAPFRETPDQRIVGRSAAGLFGLTVRGVGDVDDDGFDDLLVAAPPDSVGGRVFLYRGGSRGLAAEPAWTMGSRDSGQYLGQSIAPATNLNGDAFADLVIGAPGVRPHQVGEVHVFAGSRTGPARFPTQVLRGVVPHGQFGFAISAGDVNHDGRNDLLVGEPCTDGSGRAYLYMSRGDSLAPTPAWTYVGPESSLFGVALALGGDLNNDGYGDAVIGAPGASFPGTGSQSGATYVFLGSAGGLSTTPTILPGRQSGALAGRDVFFAGDIDGDGFQDLFVGAEQASNGEESEGIAEIYYGSRGGVSPFGATLLEPNVAGANFGGHGARLGDVDGDGCSDLFVGALRYQRTDPRAGAAYIFHGSRRRALQRSWLRVGPRGGAWYGADGGLAGDLNGDGFPDFVVGAPSWDAEAGQNTGMIEIFLNTRGR